MNAPIGKLYVNDAFGSAHRAHASTEGVTKYFKQSAAGYLMQKELDYLGKALSNPQRPFVAILGGAKISEKLLVIDNLLTKADAVLIGGGMAFTFVKAKGGRIGASLAEDDRLEYCRGVLDKVKNNGLKMLLPIDIIVSEDVQNPKPEVTAIDGKPTTTKGLDIGPQTCN